MVLLKTVRATVSAVSAFSGRVITDLPIMLSGILATPEAELAQIISRVGFHNTKARHLRATAQIITDQYNGEVPGKIRQLNVLSRG